LSPPFTLVGLLAAESKFQQVLLKRKIPGDISVEYLGSISGKNLKGITRKYPGSISVKNLRDHSGNICRIF
jgi:hypothetical protein